MNSVLTPSGTTRTSDAPAPRTFIAPALRPAGSRRVMPSWFRRAVGNNFGKVGVSTFAGARLGN